MEQSLLSAALKDRVAFNQLEKLGVDSELSPIGRTVFTSIQEYYYADDGAKQVQKDILRAKLADINNPKHRDAVLGLYDVLEPESVSAPNIVETLRAMRLRNLGYEIAARVGAGDIGNSPALMEKFLDILAQKEAENDGILNSVGLDVLEGKVTGGALVPIAPRALAQRVGGGLIRGNHVVVFARPNKGKSAFAINQAAAVLKAGLRVMFVENEDPAAATLLRILSRLTGLPREEMFKDKPAAMRKALDQGYANFFLCDLSPGNFREIRALAEDCEPDLIILNQMRNLSVGSDSRPEQLEKASTEARNLAKKRNCVVMSITQAGDSATGKLYLSPEDIEYSKTGVNAQADLTIGIGANQELDQRGQLMLNICKNKLNNVHEGVLCRLEPHVSRIVGV